MITIIIYSKIALIIGASVTWLWSKTNLGKQLQLVKDAFSQLSTGRDNLMVQATKLHALGVEIKKELSVTSRDE